MRKAGVVTYLFGDHLGSTSVAYDDSTNGIQRQGYTAFGAERYSLGGDLPTRYQYTGQRGFEEIGLQYYGARWYDGYLNRFLSPDTIVPDPYNPLDYDRYSYARNNPVRYNDPSGHIPLDTIVDLLFLIYDVGAIIVEGPTPMNQAALAADAVCTIIPYGTGGGLAVRAGGELAVEGAIRVPLWIRSLQSAEKAVQFASNIESSGPSSSDTSSSKKTYSSLEDAQREVNNWGVEQNLNNSDQAHLDAVIKEQQGGQVIPGRTYNHIKDVQSARNGLNNALRKLDNALRSPGWNAEARAYLLHQRQTIQGRIDAIDQVLGSQ